MIERKTAPRRITIEEGPPEDAESLSDQMTPECFLCGEEHIGIGVDAVTVLRGQWLPSVEYDIPVFLLDVDTKLRIIEFPNGQLALVPDQMGKPTKHIHQECLEFIAEETYADEDDDEEEDEEED